MKKYLKNMISQQYVHYTIEPPEIYIFPSSDTCGLQNIFFSKSARDKIVVRKRNNNKLLL